MLSTIPSAIARRRRARPLRALLPVLAALAVAIPAGAQRLNDKLLNRPYADNRAWNLGFSVGLHAQDINFTHNGFVADNGATWFVEQPAFAPGFCVNGLVAFRLNNYFSVRVAPGLWFGSRDVTMVDTTNGAQEKQNIKSTFLVLPVDLKYAAMRWRNARPYVVGGVMPSYDVAKKRADILKLKNFDTFLSVGFGCDFYLPYFKFIAEVKFCFGLTDVLVHKRPDLDEEPLKQDITRALGKAKSRMVVFTLYFE